MGTITNIKFINRSTKDETFVEAKITYVTGRTSTIIFEKDDIEFLTEVFNQYGNDFPNTMMYASGHGNS